MTISKEEYNELKPYWDFQRKKEYNRELLRGAIEEIETRTGLSLQSSFDEMWSMVKEGEYQDAPNNWVPKDDTWRINGKE